MFAPGADLIVTKEVGTECKGICRTAVRSALDGDLDASKGREWLNKQRDTDELEVKHDEWGRTGHRY
jgi:hypothetical protein